MEVNELRYEAERALRYSDPPGVSVLQRQQGLLLEHYSALMAIRDTAKMHHLRLVREGILESIPSLTCERRKGRPGTFWRAVFRGSSPEVLRGLSRKHYIGSDEVRLQTWTDWIARTRAAMELDSLIHDIGQTLKHDWRTVNHTASMMGAAVANYTLQLEGLAYDASTSD